MSDPATFRLLAAAVYFVPALLWAVIAQSIWGFLRKRRPRSRAFVVLFIVGGLVAFHYALWVLIVLVRSRATGVVLLAASDAGTAVLLAVGRHFARLWPVRADAPRPAWLGVNYGVATLAAGPFVVRDLADTLRGFVTTAAMIAATAGLVLGLHALGARVADAELRRLLDLGAVLGVVLVLVPVQGWLRAGIDRLVFRRSRRRWAEAYAFLHTLSPELGVLECCRRTLAELARALQLRGAALLFASGESVTHGALALGPLAAAWPRWAGVLPRHTIGKSRFRDLPLPLIEALIEAGVVAIVPVLSPRRLWGHVLVRTDLLRASFSDEDDQAIEVVADQLGLVLDAAELLARTVAVERSLAHAEKLAAIGELAARIAHEIRNPVTAARSLAQQLAREPDSRFATEHRLILGELERVERQVAALLRFARREDFRFEPVDLSDLARTTLEGFRPRLEAGGVTLELEPADGVTAGADREN